MSQDRYIPLRSTDRSPADSYRVSKPPALLGNRELYARQRDPFFNPLRASGSSRSRSVINERPAQLRRAGPTIHTPSFVHALDSARASISSAPSRISLRQVSAGGIWTVGGSTIVQGGQIYAVPDGTGGYLASGTNAPVHTAHFLDQETFDQQVNSHQARLALALELDRASRTLLISPPPTPETPTGAEPFQIKPSDEAWDRFTQDEALFTRRKVSIDKPVPTLPFRVLDAPNLKDDYYCSILAYCQTCRTLAVALTSKVYLWTERSGVHYPPFPPARAANFVTCLSFSSHNGGRAILAISRHSGRVSLWSLFELEVRFEVPHVNPASCISFKPTVTPRQSALSSTTVSCEDLLVADDAGQLFYYSVEWPDLGSSAAGMMTLLAKIQAHTQNICGLAWTPAGDYFVTGGNDNSALLFEVATVLEYTVDLPRGRKRARASPTTQDNWSRFLSSIASPQLIVPSTYNFPIDNDARGIAMSSDASTQPEAQHRIQAPTVSLSGQVFNRVQPPQDRNWPPGAPPGSHYPPSPPPSLPMRPSFHTSFDTEVPIRSNLHKYSFYHSAAVKALAFAPWQPSLLATGGGSNDRQIHFHHTGSGATLAIINVFAQVTSLVWSKTRREIAATFGYAQPEHEIRIAVFEWPSCECVVSIPWERKVTGPGAGEVGRALWAVGYPGGPNDGVGLSDGVRSRRARRGRRRGGDERQGGEREGRQEGHEERGRFRIWNPEVAMGLEESEEQDSSDAADEDSGPPSSRSPAAAGTRTTPRRRRTTPGLRRGEGETWASRTEKEGSLIIACCDETVKFFEIWAGSSKGRKGKSGCGLGSVGGVLGGSRILEGELDLLNDGMGGTMDIIR